VLRENSGWRQHPSNGQEVLSKKTEGIVSLGDPIQSLDFQEIDEGVFGDAGTGATTWESSIAMSMFFSSNPELLYGDVVELGSGVGLGGILSALGPSLHHATELKSMTLTDYNVEVLEQCKQNVAEAYEGPLPLHVSRLDWYDFLRATEASKDHVQKYDTVIACDCAYLYPDIKALAQTMKSLLRISEKSKIHIFGPHNRVGMHELLKQLREEHSLDLIVDGIDMRRYRLKPPTGWNHMKYSSQSGSLSNSAFMERECPFAAKYDAKFIHITCSIRNKHAEESSKNASMSEID
jgi:predicted nicotinamide N-methyase